MKQFAIKIKYKGQAISIEPKPIDEQVMELLDKGVEIHDIPLIFENLPQHLRGFMTALGIVTGINKWLQKKQQEKRVLPEWEYTLENLAEETKNIVRMILASKAANDQLPKLEVPTTTEPFWDNARINSLAIEYFEQGADDVDPESIENTINAAILHVLNPKQQD